MSAKIYREKNLGPINEDGANAIKYFGNIARLHDLGELLQKHRAIWKAVADKRVDVFYGSVNAPDTPEDEQVVEIVNMLFFTYKGVTVGPFPAGVDPENGMTTTALDSFVELLEKILTEEQSQQK